MADLRIPIITLTTDFGTADPYVASMKAAIYDVLTGVHIVDVTHEIPPHDVVTAAYMIRSAFPLFPARTVHMVVVDPGVGTARRPLVVASQLQYFVGPDNGVFSLVLENDPTSVAYRITADHYFREKPSPTFHGRDIFAPIAAQLSRGIGVENVGEPIDDPVKIEIPRPKASPEGRLRATILYVDRFGNLITNITRPALEALMEKLGKRRIGGAGALAAVQQTRTTYAEGPAGVPFFLYNSADFLEIAVHEGRACDLLGLRCGEPAELQLS